MSPSELPVQIAGVDYKLLPDPQAAIPYMWMTYRRYCEALFKLGSDFPVVAVAADQNGEPAGLALGIREPKGVHAQVLSLFVVRQARKQGIATTLLAHLETELKRKGAHVAHLRYPAEKPATLAMEQILQRRGWGTALPRMYLFQGDYSAVKKISDAPFMRKGPLPPEYQIFPWKELTEEEKTELQRKERTGELPVGLSPFCEPEGLDENISVGLRHQGSVVGWMITHRLAPGKVRYTYLFVHPEIRLQGIGMRMVGTAAKRHLETDGHLPEFTGCFGSIYGNTVAHFGLRRMVPLGLNVGLILESSKWLTQQDYPGKKEVQSSQEVQFATPN